MAICWFAVMLLQVARCSTIVQHKGFCTVMFKCVITGCRLTSRVQRRSKGVMSGHAVMLLQGWLPADRGGGRGTAAAACSSGSS